MQPTPGPELRNTLILLLVTMAFFIAWQLLVEYPRQRAEYAQKLLEQQRRMTDTGALLPQADGEKAAGSPPRGELLAQSPRLPIRSDKLHGSINLRGGQFDDITLARYRETIDPHSPEVVLLSPAGAESGYFAELGWLKAGEAGKPGPALPGSSTLWQTGDAALTPSSPVTLRWDNGEGLIFIRRISMDGDYMFTVTQEVRNGGGDTATLVPYGLINRARAAAATKTPILHEGPLGVLEGALQEISYEDLKEDKSRTFRGAGGWLGVTDKYWLSALIPDGGATVTANFSYYEAKGGERYQADYLGNAVSVAPGETGKTTVRLFAGAKEVSVLDRYTDDLGIALFDRAVDFGYLYFLTKPIFRALNYLYLHLGNFGLAILLLTVGVKGLMFPLANKSYKAMNQMKALQPEIQRLKERCKDDRARFQREMMALYRKERVNPASGCLPVLIQLPVFFALYKVLYVTIEMRHAPFYGWIVDLSAADPTNMFTLFGLLSWDAPPFLHVGVLPIAMSLTMILQQKLQPKPSDPAQAKVMSWLPYIFLFMMAGFPAGLVLYWTWSNTLSILQQWVISRRHGEKPPSPAAKEKKRA